MNYEIQITKDQLLILMRALDVYSRIMTNQADIAITDIVRYLGMNVDNEALSDYLAKLKKIMFPNSPHSLGIMSPEVHDSARITFDMYQVLRYRLWLDYRQPGVIEPNEPHKTSKSSELITIKCIDKDKVDASR